MRKKVKQIKTLILWCTAATAYEMFKFTRGSQAFFFHSRYHPKYLPTQMTRR